MSPVATAESLLHQRTPHSATSEPHTASNDPQEAARLVKPASRDTKEVWWINGAFVILAHITALFTIVSVTPKWQTVVLMFAIVVFGELGITMGYHRLWSHRAYTGSLPLRIALAFMGTMGFQGSIKWWVLRHRLHHRYTDDSIHDPYSATRGFWFSHMGWIFEKPTYTRMTLVDASDLNSDPIVRLQHKYFVPLAMTSCFLLPTILGSLWGDAFASYLYGGIVSRILIWHATFCINSFAHWIGEQEFSEEHSARGTLLLAIMTFGEGYHNFHHEFPKDYRNGIHPYDWDPTKWLISLAARVGLASNLYTYPENEINKARVSTTNSKYAKLDWGPTVDSLPVVDVKQSEKVEALVGHKEWILLDGYVLDVSKFKGTHPGGVKLIETYEGKDATKAFYGVLNNHSKSARTMVDMLRVAKVAV
ncbi:fatty acid desaturase-domain-containing protein [Obelidium mucronatum]|nr:fatty acid desaturase-domain-containing protein [Obelidium mucronatum]